MAGTEMIDLTTMMPSSLVNQLSRNLQGKTPHVAQPNTPTNEPDEIETDEFKSQVHDEPQTFKPTLDSALEPTTDNPEPQLDSAATAPHEPFEPDLFTQLTDNDAPTTDNPAEAEAVELESEHRLDLPQPNVTKPNYFWTWRLLADGYTAAHLFQVRQLDEKTVFSHATLAVENKLPTQRRWLLSQEKIRAIESFVAANPGSKITELLGKIPTQLESHELIFYLKYEQCG